MPLVNILALKVSPHPPSLNKPSFIPQCGVFTTVCVSRNSINNPLPHIHPSFVFTKTWACFTISMPLILSQSLCVGRSQVSLYMDIPMLIQFILARCRQSTTCIRLGAVTLTRYACRLPVMAARKRATINYL